MNERNLKTVIDRGQYDAAQRREKAKEKTQLGDSLKNYEAAISAALKADDFEKYNQFIEQRDRIRAELAKLQGETSGPISEVTKSEVLSCWKDWTSGYNTAFRKKLAAYDNARRELFRMFSELVDMQDGALNLRLEAARTIFDISGEEIPYHDEELFRSIFNPEEIGLNGLELLPKKDSAMVLVDHCYTYLDAAYFIASGDMPSSQRERVTRIAGRQKA